MLLRDFSLSCKKIHCQRDDKVVEAGFKRLGIVRIMVDSDLISVL